MVDIPAESGPEFVDIIASGFLFLVAGREIMAFIGGKLGCKLLYKGVGVIEVGIFARVSCLNLQTTL